VGVVQNDDSGREFAALNFVNRACVGKGDRIELVALVLHLASVETNVGDTVFDAMHFAEVTVVDFLLVVISKLHHLVPASKRCGHCVGEGTWVESLLEDFVEPVGAKWTATHRSHHLHIGQGIEAVGHGHSA